MHGLKKLASHLPPSWQQELKRLQYRRQMRRGTFAPPELEYGILHELIGPGDWVVDIGANVGHYTKKLSDLVGQSGRVIAFEPVPETFALLAANVALFSHRNVTLLNLAASDQTAVAGIRIPDFRETGLKNYYEASLTAQAAELQVLTAAVDSLAINQRVRLVKIDAEGHDPIVLRGLARLLERDRPTLIVETENKDVVDNLASLGYQTRKLPDSHNTIFRWSSPSS